MSSGRGFHRDIEHLPFPLAIGTLRLTDKGRPEPDEAENVLLYALREGIRLLDTADSYCQSDDDFHYGEHLIRRVMAQWQGDKDEVKILTKVGMTRPGGKWKPNGAADHIRQSIEGSLQALGVEQIFLLQLHVRDPQVPYEKTLEVLAKAQETGKVRHIGLCNSNISEVEQAEKYFPVASLQNEFSLINTRTATEGQLKYATEKDLPLLAYRPLGGLAGRNRIRKNRILQSLAERHQATAEEIAIAGLRCLAPSVIPLVGATRLASVKSSIKSMQLKLDVSDETALSLIADFSPASSLDSAKTAGKGYRNRPQKLDSIETTGPRTNPEVVMVMGIQGAGKSELVKSFVEAGYDRLNRDELGGTLDDLLPHLRKQLGSGTRRVVLDNTYPTVQSRRGVIEMSRLAGVDVRCCFLQTSIEDAWKNIAQRMVARYGMPLGPAEMKFFRKQDPNLPPPQALARWKQLFESPSTAEGFDEVAFIPFQRRNTHYQGKGLFLDVDGTLRVTRSGEVYPRTADDVVLLPGRKKVLKDWQSRGYQLFFVSNQSGIASGHVSHQAVQGAMLKTAELLEVAITEVVYCPHPHHPVGCFCRKPMPGLGVYLIERHQLNPEEIVMVGDRDSDSGFAKNLGVRYYDVEEFFP